MLYFPDDQHRIAFELFTWPLPSKLLPWLYERGLGIWSLPEDVKQARLIVHGHIGIKRKKLLKDGRRITETAHYDTRRKIIILPHRALCRGNKNVVLHEIGHAVDCLYCPGRLLVSSYAGVVKVLRPDKPFNDYCAERHKETGLLMEQFATAFAAYFHEPEGAEHKDITDLSPEAVEFFRTRFVEPFEEKKDADN